jgi:hypothetical protein
VDIAASASCAIIEIISNDELNASCVAPKAEFNQPGQQHKMIGKCEHEIRLDKKWFSTFNTPHALDLPKHQACIILDTFLIKRVYKRLGSKLL